MNPFADPDLYTMFFRTAIVVYQNVVVVFNGVFGYQARVIKALSVFERDVQ